MKKLLIALALAAVLLSCLVPAAAFAVDEAETEEATLVDDDWYAAVPYESWDQFEPVETDQSWYDVYKMPGDVYAICCNGQWELDICYLILGGDQALLLDTGLGLGDLKSLVDTLTDLPVSVLVSHSHYDHVGNAHQFDDVWCYDSEACVDTLTGGIEHDVFAYELEEGMIARELPRDIDLDTYAIPGAEVTRTVKDGEVIDLGGRTLEVLWTPGHTGDSIMVIDEANGILFTGDTYYPDDLYAWSDDSDVTVYADSMRKAADRIADMDLAWIYPGHNEIVTGTDVIGEVADDLEQIVSGEKTDYVIGEEDYRYYDFPNDIRIVTLDEDPA